MSVTTAYYNVGIEVSILDGLLAVRDTTCYTQNADCKLITKTKIKVYVPYTASEAITQLVYPTVDYNSEVTFSGTIADGVIRVVLNMYTEDGLENTVEAYYLNLQTLEKKLANLLLETYIDACDCNAAYNKLINQISQFNYAMRILHRCERFDDVTKLLCKINELIQVFDCECTTAY